MSPSYFNIGSLMNLYESLYNIAEVEVEDTTLHFTNVIETTCEIVKEE